MRFRDKFSAGALSNRKGAGFTQVNSFVGTNISSYVAGDSAWRGIATVASGTTVATVAAAAVRSGDAIYLTPYNFSLAPNSANFCLVLTAQSVTAGQFLIQTAGSVAPPQAMPVAWHVLR